jgi:hypothetical protein
MALTLGRRRKYVSNQMITFSFRTTPEAVRKLRKEARQRKITCGALLREMLLNLKEENHESESHKNACNPITPGLGL